VYRIVDTDMGPAFFSRKGVNSSLFPSSELEYTNTRVIRRDMGAGSPSRRRVGRTVDSTGVDEHTVSTSKRLSSGHCQLDDDLLNDHPVSNSRAEVEPSLVVFSGGTAFNSVAADVKKLTTRVSYVLPVSDDGGSTAEIVRVLGGPAVGDIRSRCLRLADDTDEEAQAVKRLLAHRLSREDAEEAKHEWYRIVEGDHMLWEGVSEPYKHTIRAFLVHFHAQILRHSSEKFNFRGGSIGNFFFAGARTFLRSLEAAIFMFTRVARIPEGSMVLPAICTEERIKLAAEVDNGAVIVGQHAISHPSSNGDLAVDKSYWEDLDHPVRRIFYLSSEGDTKEHEVAPVANPRVVGELERADAIVYGMGSLYTSICPCLILRGTGEAIATRHCPKILVLNGVMDREMSSSLSHPGPMKASDVVLAVTDALNRRGASSKVGELRHLPSRYVTEIIVPRGGPIEIDRESLGELGVKRVIEVDSEDVEGGVHFDPDALIRSISSLL
jgi:2-phospho-L-lactate transferase/gluconeogenesis factor (CofD/UPF0052 family)